MGAMCQRREHVGMMGTGWEQVGMGKEQVGMGSGEGCEQVGMMGMREELVVQGACALREKMVG